MKNIYYFILISIFSLTVISCAKKDDSSSSSDNSSSVQVEHLLRLVPLEPC